MKKLFLLLLISGLATNASAQIPAPDTTASDSLQAKPKPDTTIVQGADTSSRVAGTLVSGKKSNLRSPSGALLRSLAVPGWGQLYNKKYFKTVIVAGGQGVLLGTAIVEWKRATNAKNDASLPLATRLEDYRLHTNNRNMLLWLYAAATVVSMLDAYVDAHLSQDTGEGVPKIGNIIIAPSYEKKSLILKLRLNF